MAGQMGFEITLKGVAHFERGPGGRGGYEVRFHLRQPGVVEFDIPIQVSMDEASDENVVRVAKHRLHLACQKLAEQTGSMAMSDEDLDKARW